MKVSGIVSGTAASAGVAMSAVIPAAVVAAARNNASDFRAMSTCLLVVGDFLDPGVRVRDDTEGDVGGARAVLRARPALRGSRWAALSESALSIKALSAICQRLGRTAVNHGPPSGCSLGGPPSTLPVGRIDMRARSTV
ncbi:hypothetical protein KNE206_63330 [Kitasatospora sp. NE20-6]